MKKEYDKIIFVVVLFAILVFCIFFSKDYMTYNMSNDSELVINYDLINKSLSVEILDDATIKIEGEGLISYDDINALLGVNDIKVYDIENVIIGDSIQEIGYDVFNGYYYLKVLKVGKSVKKIHNGAIRNCPNLSFVFLPAGIEKLGGGIF